MIAIGIQHAIAARAFHVLLGKPHPQPTPEHANKQGRFVVKLGGFAGGGLQVDPRTLNTEEFEVGPAGLASVGRQLHAGALVDGGRHGFLRKTLEVAGGQLVVVVNAAVVGVASRLLGRLGLFSP